MEPQTKKIKLAEDHQYQFLDLNANCILSILEWLPLSDLCSISFTCKHLQSLAEREYHRKNPNESITVDIKRRSAFKGELKFANDEEKTKKYFGKVIPNVRFYEANNFRIIGVDVDLLYNFMKTDCCESLKSLSIHILSPVNIDKNIHPDEYVEKQLKSVHSLTVEKLESVPAVWNSIVKYCVNLNTLTIMDDEFPWASIISLPRLENLQKLTVFESDGIFDSGVNAFFHGISINCPNLEVLEMRHRNILSPFLFAELMKSCVLHLRRLKNFTLNYIGRFSLCFDSNDMTELMANLQSQQNATVTEPLGPTVDENSSSLSIICPQQNPLPTLSTDSYSESDDDIYLDSDDSLELLGPMVDEDSDSYSSVYMKEFPSATFSSDNSSDSDDFYSF